MTERTRYSIGEQGEVELPEGFNWCPYRPDHLQYQDCEVEVRGHDFSRGAALNVAISALMRLAGQ